MVILAFVLAAGSLDPCKLLGAKTIAAVQGAAPVSTKATEHRRGELVARQCFFALPDVSRSVSLEVTTGPRKALRERWERIVGHEEKSAEAEEEGGAEPKPVKGVGRAAVWTGSQKAGALYVLSKSAILRVSVGGPASEAEKTHASAELARAALRVGK